MVGPENPTAVINQLSVFVNLFLLRVFFGLLFIASAKFLYYESFNIVPELALWVMVSCTQSPNYNRNIFKGESIESTFEDSLNLLVQ